MNKLFKVVNVELRPAPKGSFVMVCLLDYTPDVEAVDPRKEKVDQTLAGLPKEVQEGVRPMLEGLMSFNDLQALGQQDPRHSAHRETASILLTSREYQEMGNPTVGQLLKVDLALTKPEATD